MRIGHGYDVHKLVEGRPLWLGGIRIPHEKGLLGHSDADVLLHAIMDSLLGAAALGDIGRHFPDQDPAYQDADSKKLLETVREKIKRAGFRILNLDATILAQAPRLAGYLPQMQEGIAHLLEISPNQVNIKATTEEGLGFTGQKEGMAAHCVCLLEEMPPSDDEKTKK